MQPAEHSCCASCIEKKLRLTLGLPVATYNNYFKDAEEIQIVWIYFCRLKYFNLNAALMQFKVLTNFAMYLPSNDHV